MSSEYDDLKRRVEKLEGELAEAKKSLVRLSQWSMCLSRRSHGPSTIQLKVFDYRLAPLEQWPVLCPIRNLRQALTPIVGRRIKDQGNQADLEVPRGRVVVESRLNVGQVGAIRLH